MLDPLEQFICLLLLKKIRENAGLLISNKKQVRKCTTTIPLQQQQQKNNANFSGNFNPQTLN